MEVNAISGRAEMIDKTEADRKEFSDSKLHRAITEALVSANSEEQKSSPFKVLPMTDNSMILNETNSPENK